VHKTFALNRTGGVSMKAKTGIILCILFAVNYSLTAQDWVLKTKEQLLDEKYRWNNYPYSSDDVTNLAINSKEYFFRANEYREKGDFNNALKHYEMALSMYTWGAYYYQYGFCLMDTGDYAGAEKAFTKAIDLINPYYDPYTLIAPYYPETGKNTIYTFDQNGVVREKYFSYYNLACIYSLTNRLNESIDYIKLAIEYGYPYLNHIFTDPDLKKVFNLPNSTKIKEEINAVYSAGTINSVSGKTYEQRPAPNDFINYEFVDNSHVKKHLRTSEDRDHVLYGTYKITNYHIIIHYNRATGRKGQNYIPGGGVIGVYETYVPYDKAVNETEYISIKEMKEDDTTWKIVYVPFKIIEGGGAVAYSPDGTYFAVAERPDGSGTIKIFEAAAGNLAYTLSAQGYHADMRYSPNSQYMVFANWDAGIEIWDLTTRTLYKSLSHWDGTEDFHTDFVRTVAYSPDGRFVASGANDYLIKIWDTAGWRVLFTLPGHGVINQLNFSPDGKYLVSAGSDYAVRIWNVSDGKLLRTMKAERSVNTAVYSPDGKYIAAGYDDSDNKTRIWDAATGELVCTLDSGRTWKLAYSPDGKYLAAATTDSRAGKGGVKLYDTQNWNFVTVTDEGSQHVACSPDGRYIILSGFSTTRIYHTQK
jgi:WD40 repeat protein